MLVELRGKESGSRTRESVVLVRGVPDGVVHDVARADGEGSVRGHVGNGGIHAIRQTHGRVAVVVAVRARGRVADAGLVILRIRPC